MWTSARTVLMLLVLFFTTGGALAQNPAALATQTIAPTSASSGASPSDEALNALRAAGNTVIVVPAQDAASAVAAAAAPAAGPTLKEKIAQVRLALDPMFAQVPTLHTQAFDALRLAGNGSLAWFWRALAVGVVGLLAGAAGLFVAGRIMWRIIPGTDTARTGEDRAVRLDMTLRRTTRGIVGAAAFAGTGTLAVLAAVPQLSPEQVTAIALVNAVGVFLAARITLLALLSPDDAHARLVPFCDPLSARLYRQSIGVVVLANIAAGLCFWLANFPLAHTAHQLMLMFAVTVMMGLLAVIALINRGQIHAAILSGSTTRLKRIVAIIWLPALLVYLASSWVLNVSNIALDTQFLVLPTMAPLIASVVCLYVAGLLILLYDRYVRWTPEVTSWSRLFHNMAFGAGTLAGFVVLGQFYPLTRYTGTETETVTALGLVILALWMLWRSIEIWVAERLEVEEPASATDGDHEDGMGTGTTRMATLLPILRNLAMFVIGAIGLTVLLASLGVNVAPLFAGAGVVGLAIGFGAQTLIRDMFSGAFFLLDDAFRRGEFVQVNDSMGAVERISIRSFQLRDSKGALSTIPFGEIKQLTNFSRDWVIMKLPMRLTYDTDVEKVRKLIKKLGQQMLDDPEIGPLFLEPLKSQGVIEMEDSAMIVRVKFKTTPGNQFVLRRHVYHAIRALFEKEDIHFAHRQVTVRVEGDADDEQRRKAALAAAREAIESDEMAAPAPLSAADMR